MGWPASTQARMGAALLGVGVALLAAGAVVTLTDDDTSVAARRRAPTAAPTSTTAASKPTTAAREAPDRFIASLAAALRTGDVDYLLARLHPVVIERYGNDQCRAAMTNFSNDPTAAMNVKTVGSAVVFDYNQDGISTRVPDAIPVDIDLTTRGVTSAQRLPVVYVGDQPRWFSDCGTPLNR